MARHTKPYNLDLDRDRFETIRLRGRLRIEQKWPRHAAPRPARDHSLLCALSDRRPSPYCWCGVGSL